MNKTNTIPSYSTETLLSLRLDSNNPSDSDNLKNMVTIKTNFGKKKIDIVRYRKYENFFPDWEE